MIVNAAKAYDVRPERAQVAYRHLSGWQAFNEETLRYRTFLDAAYYSCREGNVSGRARIAAGPRVSRRAYPHHRAPRGAGRAHHERRI
jgi:hypothetical protein